MSSAEMRKASIDTLRKLSMIAVSFMVLLAAFHYTPVQRAKAAGCATGELGSANATLAVAAADADSYRPWLQLKGSGVATVAVELDGTTCFTQSVSGLNASTWTWSAIGTAQPISAGNHTVKVKVYTDGVSLLGGRLINDTCVPSGDGSNCNTLIVTPTPTASATPTPSATPAATPTQTIAPTPTPIPTSAPTTTLSTGTWNDSILTYAGSWSTGDAGNGAYNKYLGSDRYSATTGSSVSFKFRGSSVNVYGAKAPWHGLAEVSIDSVVVGTIDSFATARSDQELIFSKSGISTSVDHTMSIRVLGAHSIGSTGDTIAIDKVTIDVATPTPTPIATPTPTSSTSPSATPTGTPTPVTAPVFKGFTLSYNWLSAIFLGEPGCTTRTGCQMTITWTPVSGATGYDIVRPGKPNISTTGTSFVDTSVNAYGTYVYQVVAKVNNSTASSPVVSKYIGCAWIVCGVQ